MKVLFLDIDGVLNNEATKERCSQGRFKGFIGLDKRLLGLYLDWIKDKPIEVVISSTWRLDQDQLAEMANHGIKWRDVTANLGYRGREVQAWISQHMPDKFAILDDIQQFYAWQLPHFIQTSYIHGLRPKNLKKVEAILNLNPPSSNGRTADFESAN